MRKNSIHTAIVLAILAALPAGAAISYTTAGSTEGQNFNTLASTGTANTWTNDTTLAGWYYWQSQGTANPTTYTASSGSAATVSQILSLGSVDSGDRALGAQSSSSSIAVIHYGVEYLNNTGSTLNSFTIAYTGEQWRVSNQAADTLFLEYGVFAASNTNRLASNTSEGWTSTGLNFTSPKFSLAAASLDGNDPANRLVISGTIDGINWGAGQELWLRWRDTGTQQMMGIDDVSFSAAIPEPSAALLGALGTLLLFRRRRSC